MQSNRNYLRAQTRTRHAPRNRGKFTTLAVTPLPHPDDYHPNAFYWQAQHKPALDSRPADLRGDVWNQLADLIWPGDDLRAITWKEAVLKIEKAVALWRAGDRDLETLAAKVNAA